MNGKTAIFGAAALKTGKAAPAGARRCRTAAATCMAGNQRVREQRLALSASKQRGRFMVCIQKKPVRRHRNYGIW